MTRQRTRVWVGAVILPAVLAGCGEYDPPEQAEPAERVTATPSDSALVPGAGEPGPQPQDD